MRILRLPKNTSKELDKIYRDFWRGDERRGKCLHTTKWKEICKLIEDRDLGLGDPNNNNLALLVRTW